jgi:hypothetical protein
MMDAMGNELAYEMAESVEAVIDVTVGEVDEPTAITPPVIVRRTKKPIIRNNNYRRRKEENDYYKTGNPIRNMWASVIRRALDDLKMAPVVKNKRKWVIDRQSMWFFEGDTSSLPWICRALDIDVGAVRKKAWEIYNAKQNGLPVS